MNDVQISWRGAFASSEVNALHAEAFETRVFAQEEWDWAALCDRYSLGWVTARSRTGQGDGGEGDGGEGDGGQVDGTELVGFLNVAWDGFIHAWLQDVMVAAAQRNRGIGVRIVHTARDAARAAGCEHLHVDFDGDLARFYIDACGFTPSSAGLISFD